MTTRTSVASEGGRSAWLTASGWGAVGGGGCVVRMFGW